MKKYSGLCDEEIKLSRNKHGSNKLTQIKSETFFEKYFKSFDDPIITILLLALGINIIFTFFGKVDWFECVGILISILISTFISTLSEHKNEKNFNQILDDASNISSKVYRNNSLYNINIDDIVCGDYILLQPGDMIPADGIIIDGSIRVDQSILNGENKDIEKYPGNETMSETVDFWNKYTLYRGSTVTNGQCVMKACKVGDSTVYGKLNSATKEEKRESPLTIKLKELASGISRFGYIGALLTFLIIMFQKIFLNNNFDLVLISNYFSDFTQFFADIIDALIMGIVVIVVAVPEGLPLMIAIVSSLNMKKMLKNSVLVRKLSGIETSGSMNMLFCDKTGTITKGKLEVTDLITGDTKIFNQNNNFSEKFKKILYTSLLYNSSVHISNNEIIGGNSTEKALISYIRNFNIKLDITKLDENFFSSTNKFSSALVKGDFNGTLYKGAPEKILDNCTNYLDIDGNIKPLTTKYQLNNIINNYACEQKRMIAVAYTEKTSDLNIIPDNLILIALIALKDEIRFNVRSSVQAVQMAGIQVVMITGDKKETAVSVAKEAGIINSDTDIILTSKELSQKTDDEIKGMMNKIKVIARALPTDKSRLIKLSQSLGYVTGMTGDGVNDCPALKNADIGFSMGSGTEAAKNAGDIVIIDDNFSSIKNAILYGRTIYKSIKKFICFQLTINLAAVSVSILGPILGIYKPLNISQMLWINLLMDTLAAIAFGGEAALNKYLLERPKKRNEQILDKKLWSSVLTGGIFVALMSFLMFHFDWFQNLFRESNDNIYFYTGYFSFFIFTCIFNAFNTRCESIDLFDHLSCNKMFIFILSMIFIIQIMMTYFGGAILRTAGLNFKEWLWVIVFSILIVPVDLIRKIIVK